MTFKRKLKAKKIEIKPLSEKKLPSFESKTKLSVVKPAFEDRDIDNESDKSTDQKKLSCYRHISELYQDDTLSLAAIMKGALEIIAHGVEANGGSLWIYDENIKKLVCKVAIGDGAEGLQGVEISPNNGLVGWAFENKRSTIVVDTSNDERFSKKSDKQNKFETKSLIASPLIYGSEVIGVLEVINKKNIDEMFSDSDRYLIDDLCLPASMYIKNKRIVREQRSILHRMKTFSELHNQFSSTMELDKLLNIVLSKAINITNAEVGSIWLVDKSEEGVECSIAEGPTKDKVIGLKLKKGIGIIGWVTENKSPLIVEDCSKDSRFSKAVDNKIDFVTKTMICAPLIVQNECLGAIQIINRNNSNVLFNHEDLELLSLFSAVSAMHIKNAQLFESETKAKELSALIEISKEITSTLDLDSVLMSIVNLSSHIVPYDSAYMAKEVRGKKDIYEIRAQSGEEKVNRDDEKVVNLEKLFNLFMKEEKKEIYIKSSEEYIKTEDKLQDLENYLGAKELKSFWFKVLEDDQGVVGMMSMESVNPNLIEEGKDEIINLLTSQSTVALRNAELYDTIPSGNIFKQAKSNALDIVDIFKEMQPKKRIMSGACAIGVVLTLIFIKVPHNIDAEIEILPVTNTYYSQGSGIIEKVFVKEGQFVKKGELLALLSTNDQGLELKQKEFQLQKVRSEMLKHRSEKRIADYKIKEKEMISLGLEIELLEDKIRKSKIISEASGVVVSVELDNLTGLPVNFGQEIIKIANNDKLYAKFNVPEEHVLAVKSGQEVKFKVYGHPTKSFYQNMKLYSVAGEGVSLTDVDPNHYYPAKAIVDKTIEDNNLLRPGMTGRGKIYTDYITLANKLFGKIYRFFMMEVFF